MVSATGFWWGRAEHWFERTTNWCLLATILLFWFAIYQRSWDIVTVSFIAMAVTFGIHIIARVCHRIEKHYHNK